MSGILAKNVKKYLKKVYLFSKKLNQQLLSIYRMVFPNFCPRFLINTSRFLAGRTKLNKFRFVHSNSPLYSIVGVKFQTNQKIEIQRTCRCFSSDIVTKNEEKESKSSSSYVSTFQQQMRMRKQQARCSVLIELSNKRDIFSATSACEQFGDVRSAYSYSGESENIFLLVEFASEECAKKLLLNCSCRNLEDSFTTFSRIIRFDQKFEKSTPKTTVSEEVILQSAKFKKKTMSQLIEHMYVSEKLSELDTRLRFLFCELLKEAVTGLFPYCDALPFGSSVNGFGKQGCDLDIMIRLYPPSQANQDSEFYFLNKTCIGNMLQKKSIYALGTLFSTFLPGFSNVQKILHARVPIVKFRHNITAMDCDISVNNMSAILMSEILYFCGEIDSRVRPLLYAVKKWAKDAIVTYSAPGAWITNFGLSLLVIYFLQNRPVPILPCLNEALQVIGVETEPNFGIEYLAPISDLQTKASLNTESLAVLLKEFLSFLGSHPFKNKHFSVLTGKVSDLEKWDGIWVQNPIEEHKNVTKNVSASHRHELSEKAQLSYKYITSNMDVKCSATSHFSLILGIPNLLKVFPRNSTEFHAYQLLNEKIQNNHKRKHQRKN